MLDAGYHVSCGLLNDGRLVCWGDERFVEVVPPGPFLQFDIDFNGCGLRPDGGVTCWCNSSGTDYFCNETPTRTDLVEVRAGANFACAEDRSGILRCWGGRSTLRDVPTEAVVDWDVDGYLGCALLVDGRISCWGETEGFAHAPGARTVPPKKDYVQVSVGEMHACALTTNGTAECWGSSFNETVFPDAPDVRFTTVVSGGSNSCGLLADGQVRCWHDRRFYPDWTVPREAFTQLGPSGGTICGVTTDGSGLCFPEEYDWSPGGINDVPDLTDL